MFTQPRQQPLSIRSAHGWRILVLVVTVLACILVLVVAGWFIDHARYHQVAHAIKKALLKHKQEVVWLRGKLAEYEEQGLARAEAFSKAHDKMKQEALHQQQQMAEYEEQGLARAEALLEEETAMRRKLDQMLEKEKAARISAQTLLTEEKELRMQLEAQHEEFFEKQHASLKML